MQFELTKEYLEHLNGAVENGQQAELDILIDGLHAVDIAEILEEQTKDEAKAFYLVLPEE